MVEIARENYRFSNLSFQVEDGERLSGFEAGSVHGFFNCSSIHHITSYNGYDNNHAIRTLQRQVDLLAERGIVVVRDFVKPEEKEILLELSVKDKPDRPNDADLLMQFASTARSLSPKAERGFPLYELESRTTNTRCFRLYYTDAVEFIRRKDYFANWDIELQEEYGYFTQDQFEKLFHDLGLRIIISSPIYNQWIINNRYRREFRLFDLTGDEIAFPPTNFLIVGEKNNKGKQLTPIRHLPVKGKAFLRHFSFKNKETGKVYDVVERSQEVTDIIPYFKEKERMTILAKHGYPRPLLCVETDSPILDQRHFSGYITEGLTMGSVLDRAKILENRFGISSADYLSVDPALDYFTSPGGINEKVESVYIPLNKLPEDISILSKGYSGFHE